MAWLNGKRTIYCRYCGNKGHNRRSCPSLSPEMKARYTTGDRARKCSYCHESGHNRASCKTLKIDKVAYIQENAMFRFAALNDMKNAGIGIGALVSHSHYNGEPTNIDMLNPDDLYIITEIAWDAVQARRPGQYIFHAQSVKDQSYTDSFSLPGASSWRVARVLSAATPESIEASVPSNWLKGESNIDQFFNRK